MTVPAVSRTLWTAALAFGLMCVGGASADAHQPKRRMGQDTMVTVPSRVVVDPEGKVKVETKEVRIAVDQNENEVLPRTAPVVTQVKKGTRLTFLINPRVESVDGTLTFQADPLEITVPETLQPGAVIREAEPRVVASEGGEVALVSGFLARGSSDGKPRVHKYPGRLVFDGSKYRVDMLLLRTGRKDDWVPPTSHEIQVLYSEPPAITDPVMLEGAKQGGLRGPSLDLRYLPIFPFDPIQLALLDVVIARVETRTETILAGSIGFEDIDITVGNVSNIAETATFAAVLPYDEVRDRINVVAESLGESNDELNLYENLLGDSIQVFQDDATPTIPESVDSIAVDLSLARHLLFAVPQVPDTLTFRLGAQVFFPPDGLNVIRPGQRNIEGILQHETLHALGFVSGIDTAPEFPFYVWDIFRFDDTVGDAISLSEWINRPRNHRLDVESVAGMAINLTNMVIGLSRGTVGPFGTEGDGEEGSHWKNSQIGPPFVWRGIMDPVEVLNAPGPPSPVTYTFYTDRRAMDVMGWFHDTASVGTSPGPAILIEPAPGEDDVSRPADLAWAPGDGADVFSVYVTSGVTVRDERTLAFEMFNTAATTVTVPAEALRPGRVYSWAVVSVNLWGTVFGDFSTFTTAGCSADWDRNNTVNSTDISTFLTGWTQDVNSGELSSDFDDSGSVNSSDISAFLSAWTAQTATPCAR